MPFELRPEPHPTLRPEGDYLQRAWAERVYPIARRMGVPINMPKASPQPHTPRIDQVGGGGRGWTEFEEALRTRKYRQAHQRALRHAYNEAGVTGVPMFVIGKRVLTGLQEKETLEEVIMEEQARNLAN
jgi:hypothetical protein